MPSAMEKLNGNIWNVSACNRLVNERNADRRHEKHLRALEATKTMVDNSAPADHPHLRTKSKTKKHQEDRSAQIQLENRILLQKMLSIDTKPCPVSGETLLSQRVPSRSLHGEAQRRELDRITAANQEMLRRLQNARPSMELQALEEKEMDRQGLKYRISQNSTRGRMMKLPMPEQSAGRMSLSKATGSTKLLKDDWEHLSAYELDRQLFDFERLHSSSSQKPAIGPSVSC